MSLPEEHLQFCGAQKSNWMVVNMEHWSREMWPVKLGGFTPWNILTYGDARFSGFLEKNRIYFHLKFLLVVCPCFCLKRFFLDDL